MQRRLSPIRSMIKISGEEFYLAILVSNDYRIFLFVTEIKLDRFTYVFHRLLIPCSPASPFTIYQTQKSSWQAERGIAFPSTIAPPNAIHFSINMIGIVDPDGWSTSVTQLGSPSTWFTLRLRSTKKCKFVNDTTPTDSFTTSIVPKTCRSFAKNPLHNDSRAALNGG